MASAGSAEERDLSSGLTRKQARIVRDNWRREMEAAQTYQALADGEQNPRRRELLAEMAGMEREHARVWEQRLREAGLEPPSPPSGLRAWFYGKLARHAGPAATLERIEKDEEKHSGLFRSQMRQMDSADAALLEQIAHDEDVLARRLHMANAATREQGELDYIFGKEKWHVRSGSWVADAVYGANDGLGAVFGIVSGMAGYTGGSSLVLVAGLAGTVAGALSMGSSAYLAAKSEKEVIEAELERERLEIAENPEEERRELELFYRLKGFSDEETAILVNRVSRSDEHLLQALAHEELGISHASAPNPLTSMVSATLSTTAGGLIPLIPFFFMTGMTAVAIALVISLLAHFAVGVLKSLLTTRNWFASGMEMTVVGVVVSVLTFALGKLLETMGLPGAG